ncbi:uncharacterized protein LOC131049405 isoform X2 [Cryptomeria japonica]|uniref:uncharacterized protein LOC131049405 isoform X2 n=1 Tax=Cryptomeria japonica TaxID=3369 RepID=UPI0027DAB454|nr:uncharacterized protein LOC131049405 isoform X2 [Cryptomeria japonica]
MAAALILSPPTLALSLNSPIPLINNLIGKYRNGFSIWVYNTSKLSVMGNTKRSRPRTAKYPIIKALQNKGRVDEWDEIVINQSLLAKSPELEGMCSFLCSKRRLLTVAVILALFLTSKHSIAVETAEKRNANLSQKEPEKSSTVDSTKKSVPKKSIFSGLLNTQSWYRFRGNGFSLRVPPDFDDIMEPEDYSAGSSLYGERAKPKTFAARFASPDRSEVLSVVIKPSNELKLSFLEAQDISDFGSLREAAGLFIPGGATLYAARTIKFKESDVPRTYYFYEFSAQDRHVTLEAAVSQGKPLDLSGRMLVISCVQLQYHLPLYN